MRLQLLLLLFLTKVSTRSSTHPRLAFPHSVINPKTIRLPSRRVQLIENEENGVIVNTGQQLFSLDFHELKQTVSWKGGCDGANQQNKSCDITVLHKRKGPNQVFLCVTAEMTMCCNMELSTSAKCSPHPPGLQGLTNIIKPYGLKAGEPSVLIESTDNEELYITQSASSTDISIGIYKFGKNQLRPAAPENAQVSVQHLGLVANRQDKVYAFFKEKHPAGSLESDKWLPFVAQVCMADTGGTKTILEYRWTSQLKARLFCGDRDSGQHYPELVDVSFLHKEDGALFAVYALFRNEWFMSAVCVYPIADIEKVFKTSAFKANEAPVPSQRPGTCTYSHKPDRQTLTFMQKQPEVEDRVRSMNNAGPLLVSQHHYTHILLDTAHNHTLLYLSLVSGSVHKVLDNKTRAFIIAEYSPFANRVHILDMILHKPTRKLYVSSSKEVVQVDVQSCEKYGPQCQDCVLARDPYCGWNGHQCVEATSETLQDVEKGDHTICSSLKVHKDLRPTFRRQLQLRPTDPQGFSVLMRCPVSSRHAEYTWHSPGNITTCDVIEKSECNMLIEDVVLEHRGDYRCMVEEQGHKKIAALFELRVESSAALVASAAPLAWICMMVLVISVLGESWL